MANCGHCHGKPWCKYLVFTGTTITWQQMCLINGFYVTFLNTVNEFTVHDIIESTHTNESIQETDIYVFSV